MTKLDLDSPVNRLADRFWEAVLEDSPTTATMYGDERYDDRLEDPSPEGRAQRRALMVSTWPRRARSTPPTSPSRIGSPST